MARDLGGGRARNVFWGLGFGALYKLAIDGLHLVPGKVTVAIPLLPKAELGCKVGPAFCRVG